ncbi:MAG TPA: dethiobiotin synthase [Acidimicrobiales bacterium]|nr:dethiobiotin synthase [Acidimicrobiales bacterium]
MLVRPECLVLVTGTGTDVGKTWVMASLTSALRAGGATVAARKPVLSFDPQEAGGADGALTGGRAGSAGAVAGTTGAGRVGSVTTDAEVLAAATGEDPMEICPVHRRYPLAMAPPIAATALGRPAFTVADLVAELRWPSAPAVDYGLVEGVGGPCSPLAADGDTVTLAKLLDPDQVVLVAGAGLGTLNAVLLSAAALAPTQPVVLLNRFDEADQVHVTNRDWLRRHTDLLVATGIAALATSFRPAVPAARIATELSRARPPACGGRPASAGPPPAPDPWS